MQPRSRGTADLELVKSHFRALFGRRAFPSKIVQKCITKGPGGKNGGRSPESPRSLRDAFLRDSCCEHPKVL